MGKALTIGRYERTRRIVESEGFLDALTGHIANGGSLINLCDTWDVRYSDIVRFIRANPKWNAAYNQSLEDRKEWHRERIMNELRFIAELDLREAYDARGRLKAPKDLPENIARAIAGIETVEVYQGGDYVGDAKKLKFWSKIDALREIGKELGLFNPVQKHLVGKTLEELVAGSYEEPAPPQLPAPEKAA